MMLKSIPAAMALVAILGATSADAKSAKPRKPVAAACVDRAVPFSLYDVIFSTGPAPQPNGCAPAVYNGGQFVGQDPDPNVRLEMMRNSAHEGYYFNH